MAYKKQRLPMTMALCALLGSSAGWGYEIETLPEGFSIHDMSDNGQLLLVQGDEDTIDNRLRNDVYIYDRVESNATLVSRAYDGQGGGNGRSLPNGLSGDGQLATFVSHAGNLLDQGSPTTRLNYFAFNKLQNKVSSILLPTGPLNYQGTIGLSVYRIHALESSATTSVISEATIAGGSGCPSAQSFLSADGQTALFCFKGPVPEANQPDDGFHLYIWKEETSELTSIASMVPYEIQEDSYGPAPFALSKNGRYVVYIEMIEHSLRPPTAHALVLIDLYKNEKRTLISQDTSGENTLMSVSNTSGKLVISGDGRYVMTWVAVLGNIEEGGVSLIDTTTSEITRLPSNMQNGVGFRINVDGSVITEGLVTGGFKVLTNFPTPQDTYAIKALHSNKLLDVEGGDASVGGDVIQWQDYGGDNQQWVIDEEGDYFRFTAKHSNLCLTLNEGQWVNNVEQNVCGTTDAQRWSLEPKTGGFNIVSALTGECIEVYNQDTNNGAWVLGAQCGSGQEQIFAIDGFDAGGPPPANDVPVGDNLSLKASHSNLLLDVGGESLASGGDVIQWADYGGANQRWSIEKDGDAYRVSAKHSGLCLTMHETWVNNVEQQSCDNSDKQRWNISPSGEGYTLVSVKTQECVEVFESQTSNGAWAIGGECNGGANQVFEIE